MNAQRICGIVLVAVGVVLFVIGLNAADSVADRMSNFFTGQYTDSTIWYLAGGGAMGIGGLLLILLGGGVRARA